VSSRIDHIVVTAPDLASGAELVRRTLGVAPQPGGEHVRMGTHNLLLKLGESLYLEVLAPNPDAPKPGRPRWFGLDEMKPDTPSRLATWVARTDDIRATLAVSSEPLGTVEPMSRGRLNWLITIRADGSLPLGGVAPALIEWQTETHPAAWLRQSGCSLVRLEAFHPDAPRVSALLRSISLEGPIAVAPLPAGSRPYLVAHIQTPDGLARL
jgi:Glyoxalase-like domain